MIIYTRTLFKVSLVAASVAAATSVYSAGFALNDHSATASGTALAGAAASNKDISFSFWNPALFANTTKTTFYASGAYVIPSMDVQVTEAGDAAANNLTTSSPTTSSDSVDNTLVPSVYFAKPLSDKTVAGLSLNVPFGLSGDYGNKWAGRFHATETAIRDIALSFALAHRMNNWVSVGASIQVHNADVVLKSQVGATSAPTLEGSGDISADATAYGYSFGIALEPREGTRVGLGYRSKVNFDFKGNVEYKNVNVVNLSALTPNFDLVNTSVSDSITFPSVMTLSVEQGLSDKLTLGLSALKTGWGAMDELRINFASNQPDSVLTFGFEDQWMYSAGLTYEYSDTLTLRTGVAMDNSPVTDKYRSARTPDGDRKWISFGGTYGINDMTSTTFAYTHVMIDDVKVNRARTGEDLGRGNLKADYKSSANVLSVGLNMEF